MNVDFIEILNRYGVPVVALVAIAVFVWKGIWPFLLRHLENTQKLLEDQLAAAQEERRQSMREFMAAIARRDEVAATTGKMNADALNAMTEQIKLLHQERIGATRNRK